MDQFSYIANAEPAYIESLYHEYKKDPVSVDGEWKKFFEGFEFAMASYGDGAEAISPKEFKVFNLINAYREKGHLISKTNPIRERKDRGAGLSLQELGFTEKELDERFLAGKEIGMEKGRLRDIIQHLEACYCHHIGIEYNYIVNKEEKQWLRQYLEAAPGKRQFSLERKKRILEKLNETVVFENFLNKKYVGQKRFSLEGGETTIPALDAIINQSVELGVEEVVIGMAHRGRLNVLANIMGKTYEHIFNEFEGGAIPDLTMGDGDVKYHLGYSSQVKTHSGEIVNLKLTPNPSHLEAVNPVVQGFVRAKSDIMYSSDYKRILPIIIHGDAAIAGQGVTYEVLQMSGLKGYYTGGTIHFVINNQIGFTTDFDDARSADYCTSMAAMVQSPVFHVNGDAVEDVVFVSELAAAYRARFHKDVFVDMVCYRRHGHNEGDDPKYTQPSMYKLIARHPNPREIYSEQLHKSGSIEDKLAKQMDKEFWKELQDRLDMVKQRALPYTYQPPEQSWRRLTKKIEHNYFHKQPKTAVSARRVQEIFHAIHATPENFTRLRKVDKLLKNSRAMFEKGEVDWASAELLAYGSILYDGYDVRMSGQDSKRGTFSHRHAVLYDDETNAEYNRLNHIKKGQGTFRIYNSLLSEFGALGFEYGYSLATPDVLTIWEAQFGDFANGAQTIIDQFISSGMSKWQRMSGLTLLLPHGYEGQGPEHSSARLERFLQLCAENNLIVTNITTPANFFHALRRQLAWNFRIPLIVMSPKSLLRHPLCRSSVEELSKGSFQDIIPDTDITKPEKVKRMLFCSGKIYYDLWEYRKKQGIEDVAIIRLEQIYPFPNNGIDKLVKKYRNADFYWVQEEPANMGAWFFILNSLRDYKPVLVARKPSASPATGYLKVHLEEQEELINKAFHS